MLIEFRVENHRSIRDEQAITMEASLLEDAADVRPRAVEGHDKKLLPVAALYGANASGKTNVLAAMDFLREAVMLSHRAWAPDEGIPRVPFAWGPKRSEPSEFVATFLVSGVRYEYGFVADSTSFIEEWLFAWPNGRKQVWFERDGTEFKFGEHLGGENRLTERVTRPNSLFLSAAVQNSHEQLRPIHRWFRDLRINNLPTPSGIARQMNHHEVAGVLDLNARQPALFDEPSDDLASDFRALLRNADFGIRDVKVEYEDHLIGGREVKRPRFLFRHGDEIDAWLPLASESRGTQTMFRMALPILETLRRGGVFVVDELEASLHPMLAAKIVEQFNDPKTNPKNAQLIFTTHDTNLLGRTLDAPILRRDQVWFTEKKDDGSTVVYPLTNYKPRKAENLENGYLQGRYGSVPFLGRFRLSGEESS